jgi:dihydrolipoamide dehydrogenase
MNRYSAVVIGAGPAGHTTAVRLAQLGAKVAVVERDFVGGICTNWGCTPSKSMIESAKIAGIVKKAGHYGVHVLDYIVDFKEVAARRDKVIQNAREYVSQLLQFNGVDIYLGEAEIVEMGKIRIRKGKLDLDGEVMHYSGEDEYLETDNIVLATGSQPLIPDFVNRDDTYIVSSNRLISIGELPKTLTIVGGGVIGLEFATIFSNLGSRVTIIEYMEHILAGMDHEVSHEIQRLMLENGVQILTAHKVTCGEHGSLLVEARDDHEIIEVRSEAILIAVGRKPVIEKEMFDRLGISYTEKGIGVDEYMRTNVPGVWAVGDATGKSILAHVGIQQGIVAAENMVKTGGEPLREMEYDVIPAVVYSIPEIVSVGRVPADLTGVSVYKVPFNINLRARIEEFEDGFIKVWVKDGVIIAAQAIGYNVSELMQEIANMIALRTPIEAVAEIIHAHPTYSEITRSVLEYALGKNVDFFIPESVPLPHKHLF